MLKAVKCHFLMMRAWTLAFFHAKSVLTLLLHVKFHCIYPVKIFQLTAVPSVSLLQYATDSDFIKSLKNEGSNVTFLIHKVAFFPYIP